MDQASSGAKALSNSDFPTAIKHYTQALLVNPRAVDYYIKRSTAYSRLKPADGGADKQASLRDAEFAVALAVERGKRELILAAQMRRGITLYQLDRFGDASHVFGFVKARVGGEETTAKKMDLQTAMSMQSAAGAGDKHKQELMMWELRTKNSLAKLGDGDERKAVNVRDYPDVKVPGEKELKSLLEAQLKGSATTQNEKTAENKDTTTTEKTDKSESSKQGTTAGAAPPAVTPVVNKVRHEWYQSTDRVVVTLYVKGVPKTETVIEFEDDSVSISFPTSSGTNFDFTLDPLHAPIDTSKSTCSVMSTKIEIILFKQQPGQKWPALEWSSADEVKITPSATAVSSASSNLHQPAPAAATQASGPAYPTSSKHGAKDWDKLASTLTAKKKSKSSKKKADGSVDGKKPGEAGDANDGEGSDSDAASIDSDYGSGDPVDSFFKKLYADADPDTRRAMMKSYYESEGTALSTNWSEVGKGKVDPRPPSSD